MGNAEPAGAEINFPESGHGLGHVTPTIFGNTVGYSSDSLASCYSKPIYIMHFAKFLWSTDCSLRHNQIVCLQNGVFNHFVVN